ncbi:hypothetical protein [Candidatus Pantoea persica]|uniref:hypothetical protein n=1 Tax=Candidatus Pantoea persica TaxID=2518128 RepID=UPI00215D647A|nr:hypothetical protein [Candidatus Pantoea persica]
MAALREGSDDGINRLRHLFIFVVDDAQHGVGGEFVDVLAGLVAAFGDQLAEVDSYGACSRGKYTGPVLSYLRDKKKGFRRGLNL